MTILGHWVQQNEIIVYGIPAIILAAWSLHKIFLGATETTVKGNMEVAFFVPLNAVVREEHHAILHHLGTRLVEMLLVKLM